MEPQRATPLDDPPSAERIGSGRRWVIASVVVLAVVAAGLGWRWQRAHVLVGTDNPAAFQLVACFNNLTWTAPDGSSWVVVHDAVPVGAWESEPRRLKGAVDAGTGTWKGAVWRRTVGTMHVDDVDHATFTSRTGGSLAFGRLDPGDTITTECRGVPTEPMPQATIPYAVAFSGTLAQGDPSSREGAVLVNGTVRAAAGGQVVAEAPTVNGQFALYVPALGDITITGDIGGRECASHTTTINSGVADTVNLVCQ